MFTGLKLRWWIVIVCIFSLSGCDLNTLVSRNDQGALQVTAPNTFSIFLDDSFIGKTPVFDEHLKVGNYTVKAISDESKTAQTWEAKITLSNRTLTVINIIPETENNLLGSDLIELEPIPNKQSVLIASTLPDSVIVKLNQDVKGYTPIQLDQLQTGDFTLTLSAPGYKDAVLNLKANPGYKIKIQSNLARLKSKPIIKPTDSSESAVSATDSANLQLGKTSFQPDKNGVISGIVKATDIPKPYVKILSSAPGIDWLRVRKEANASGNNEVAKVKVNTHFPFKTISSNSEWYQIEYQPSKLGWIAAKYATLIK